MNLYVSEFVLICGCIKIYLYDNFFLDTEQFGLFYQLGSRTRARDILSRIERGDQDILQSLRTHGGPLEVASALKTFLVGLRAPLMPARVQELIVGEWILQTMWYPNNDAHYFLLVNRKYYIHKIKYHALEDKWCYVGKFLHISIFWYLRSHFHSNNYCNINFLLQ